MKIEKLLENVTVTKVDRYCNVEVAGVEIDARKPLEGKVFVCLVGERFDGHEFAEQAAEKGAVAIVAEHSVAASIPVFIVKNARRALAVMCGNFYGNPANKLNIVTVVGTNGKTSTTEILSQIFSYAGYKAATVGTLGYKIGENRSEGELTTPDPMELHRHLAEMQEQGVQYVFMEASAHAIHYDKLAGIKAKVSVLTNITQDHLDFFKDMERYADVKLSYFNHLNTALAVVNSDDPYALRLINHPTVPVITYGVDNPADVFAINISDGEAGLRFTLNAFDCIFDVVTSLHGRFNVYNVMAATATAMYLGVGSMTVKNALSQIVPVPGRYNVDYVHGVRVVVDYAHTPDGLENLLKGVRKSSEGKLITVFGCGGNRDKLKRPLMGKIASEYSDHVIITEDNPRYEAQKDIADEIFAGVVADTMCERIEDRAEAIRHAFVLASRGDTVVIAGKGHERYIEKNGVKIPYSDYDILQKSKE